MKEGPQDLFLDFISDTEEGNATGRSGMREHFVIKWW